MLRLCETCGTLAEYYDGVPRVCKECHKERVRLRYQETIAEKHAYEKIRNQRPERKAHFANAQRKRRAAHPDKEKARAAVGKAIRSGKLQRQPCEVCGEEAEAHHDDYSKPLQVRWLCFKHHREVHGQRVDVGSPA